MKKLLNMNIIRNIYIVSEEKVPDSMKFHNLFKKEDSKMRIEPFLEDELRKQRSIDGSLFCTNVFGRNTRKSIRPSVSIQK